MNGVVTRIAVRQIVGGKRGALLMILPALTIAVAGLSRWASGGDTASAAGVLDGFALGFVVPITALLIAVGAVSNEIDDGSIVYVLSKPIPRWHIVVSKLIAAYAVAMLVIVIPTGIAAVVAGDSSGELAATVAVTSALAALAYVTAFFWLGIATRHTVMLGMIYALLWEGLLGTWVPNVGKASIHQWALAVGEEVAGANASPWGLRSEVALETGIIWLVIVTVAAIALATVALRRLQLRAPE